MLPLFAVHAALAHPIEEHASDAAFFHVYRAVVFSSARAEGWLYPRWAEPLNFGLGSPLFSFYPPLTYYVMDAFHALGAPHPLAWRVLVATAFCAGAIGTFGLSLSLFRRADAALVSAAVFVYAPHFLREWFDRGSPEGLAIALSPWVLWSLHRLALRPSGLRLAVAAASWALVILAHSLAALLLLPILGAFLAHLALRRGAGALPPTLGALLIGGLLSAFYVLPFVAMADSVRLDRASAPESAQPAANPVPAGELFSPVSVLDIGLDNNALAQSVGPPVAVVLLGPVAALVAWRRRRRAEASLMLLLAGLGVAAVWLQTEAATAFWLALPELSIVQFRWRLLGHLGLAAAVIGGCLLHLCPRRAAAWLAPIAIILAAGPQLPMLYPELLRQRADLAEQPTLADVRAWAARAGVPALTAFDEFRPRWRDRDVTVEEARQIAAGPIANLPRGGRVLARGHGAGWWDVTLETPIAFDGALRHLYFPGWVGTVDGLPQPVAPEDETGYARVRVPAGTHTVSLRYEGTAAERVGLWISGVSLVLLALAIPAWRARGAAVATAVNLAPRWWVPAMLALALAAKAAWLDPQTTLLRRASTCEAIDDNVVQVDVQFGEAVRLCGYRLDDDELRPGGEASLTLYWQAMQVADEPTDSFVHLLGSATNPETANRLWGQQDKPAPGGYAFKEWHRGKLYRDRYTLHVAPHTPPGAYQLEIGWWQPARDRRLRPVIHELRPQLSASALHALLVDGIVVRPDDQPVAAPDRGSGGVDPALQVE